MCSVLEHACTIFTVNASTKQCFLKIFLDARGVDRSDLSATLNEDSDIVLSATTENVVDDELVTRQVQHVLTVPHNVNPIDTQIILLRSGFLLLNIPYNVTEENTRPPDEQNVDEKTDGIVAIPQTSRSPSSDGSKSHDATSGKLEVTELDKHETIRRGNTLILIIPLDRKYKKEDINVRVVQRSVCITAVSRESSKVHVDRKSPHIIQRTFYKEYEASDCTPDPNSIVFRLENNNLHVELTVSKG